MDGKAASTLFSVGMPAPAMSHENLHLHQKRPRPHRHLHQHRHPTYATASKRLFGCSPSSSLAPTNGCQPIARCLFAQTNADCHCHHLTPTLPFRCLDRAAHDARDTRDARYALPSGASQLRSPSQADHESAFCQTTAHRVLGCASQDVSAGPLLAASYTPAPPHTRQLRQPLLLWTRSLLSVAMVPKPRAAAFASR